jgi:ATPase subunit of ABC transporter with duplicated ATPase domains
VDWLERHLAEYTGTVVAVTHDRYFLDNVAKWILEVDHGRGIHFEGNYTSWLQQKKARLELEEKVVSTRQKTLDKELEWIRMSPKARQAKSKARVASYEKLAAEQAAVRDSEIEIFIPASRSLGDQVIDVENISKAFGDKLLFENLSFRLPPGGIVGIIGPNGAGKTTLFRMLVGQEKHEDVQRDTAGRFLDRTRLAEVHDGEGGDRTGGAALFGHDQCGLLWWCKVEPGGGKYPTRLFLKPQLTKSSPPPIDTAESHNSLNDFH